MLDGYRIVALAILVAVLAGAWMFRFETVAPLIHKNRITGAVCPVYQECWARTH